MDTIATMKALKAEFPEIYAVLILTARANNEGPDVVLERLRRIVREVSKVRDAA